MMIQNEQNGFRALWFPKRVNHDEVYVLNLQTPRPEELEDLQQPSKLFKCAFINSIQNV